jgi:photosynthetic reaction center H subunit
VTNPKLVPFDVGEGSPYEPTGNPMIDAVGPAAYADRSDRPDPTLHGAPKIVPLRVAPEFWLNDKDPNPIGLKVKACDGVIAGTISEVWVDRAEPQVRYYEVRLADESRVVLLPVNFVQWPNFGFTKSDHVLVKSITAAQFKDVPAIRNPNEVTLREEDRIMGYYAGGHLYATPTRSRPII